MQALVKLVDNIERVIRGKRSVVETVVTALVARGHVLIEDVPGLGKTMLARALARSIDADYKRIQCTPDLLPADVTGVSVWRPAQQDFVFRQGPVFTNVLLVDEINRATPRTQSALLEAMEERQVSADGLSHPLAEPFFLVATQNPIEMAGTFPLPEAQLDRFLMRTAVGYPAPDVEVAIMTAQAGADHPIEALGHVISRDDLVAAQRAARATFIHASLVSYIQRLAAATRRHAHAAYGASPRGALGLMRAAQALAALHGERFVTPDHVKRLAPEVLAHRIVLEPRARVEGSSGERVVREVLDATEVPVAFAPAS